MWGLAKGTTSNGLRRHMLSTPCFYPVYRTSRATLHISQSVLRTPYCFIFTLNLALPLSSLPSPDP
jgi:hypothetical protein